MPNETEKSLALTEKQNEYILNANHRYNLKVGAVRSGKSFVDTAFVVPYRLRERSGKAGLNLILGVSKESIERNVLQPMREIYTDRLVGNIHSNTNIAMVCGEPVYCLGAEKQSQMSKIQGMSVKYCYGDEVAKWNKNVFAMLQSRLDKPYSCFDGSLNPESPNHWLKTEFLDKENIDKYVQHYQIWDNTYLPPEFVDNLCREYEGTVFYPRYILGEWTQAEGLVFPHYKEAVGECPYNLTEQSFYDISNFCLSIDYGTLNAFACLLWVQVDGVWWAWRGYYYSGRNTGVQLTDSEYADNVVELVRPLMMIQAKMYENKEIDYLGKIETIVDPSAASFIAELRKRKMFKVKDADNNVMDGIRDTNTAMRYNLIRISRNIPEWEQEAGGYVWDEKAPDDRPIKVDDHFMDATRYFVKTKRLVDKNKDRINAIDIEQMIDPMGEFSGASSMFY